MNSEKKEEKKEKLSTQVDKVIKNAKSNNIK
jgi:hypothetical protein